MYLEDSVMQKGWYTDMKKTMRRTMKFLVPFILAICLFSQASACSLFFFGGDYTDDGANLFVRIEDGDLNDENKLYLVSSAGKHKEGEEYQIGRK